MTYKVYLHVENEIYRYLPSQIESQLLHYRGKQGYGGEDSAED